MARGSIKQQENGTWRIKYDIGKDPITGKRLSTMKRGFATKKEAQKYLNERLAEVDKGMHVSTRSAPKTLGELFDYWLVNYAKQNTAPRTFEGYEYIIEGHLKPYFGKMKLADLKPHDIQTYYTVKSEDGGRLDGKEGGLSARTLLHHHRLLSEILSHAVRWEFIVRNVADAVTAPRAEEKEMIALTHEQVEILIECIEMDEKERMEENRKAVEEGALQRWSETDYLSPILNKVGTGVRRGELLGLKWSDLDLNRSTSTATIQRSLQRLVGRGLIFKEPKSKKSRRTLVLMPYIAEYLRKHKIKQAEKKLALGPALYQDNDLVFCQKDGTPIEPTEFVRVFRRVVEKAVQLSAERGLDPFPAELRLHDLRHTWATNAIKDGMPIKVVSEYLGHSNINITIQTYFHVTHDLQVSAINDLEAKRKERLKKNTL